MKLTQAHEIKPLLEHLAKYYNYGTKPDRIEVFAQELTCYPKGAIILACGELKQVAASNFPNIGDLKSACARHVVQEDKPDCAICGNSGVRMFFKKSEVEEYGAMSTGLVSFACTCLYGKIDFCGLLPVTKMPHGIYMSREAAYKADVKAPAPRQIENKNELRKLNI